MGYLPGSCVGIMGNEKRLPKLAAEGPIKLEFVPYKSYPYSLGLAF